MMGCLGAFLIFIKCGFKVKISVLLNWLPCLYCVYSLKGFLLLKWVISCIEDGQQVYWSQTKCLPFRNHESLLQFLLWYIFIFYFQECENDILQLPYILLLWWYIKIDLKKLLINMQIQGEHEFSNNQAKRVSNS